MNIFFTIHYVKRCGSRINYIRFIYTWDLVSPVFFICFVQKYYCLRQDQVLLRLREFPIWLYNYKKSIRTTRLNYVELKKKTAKFIGLWHAKLAYSLSRSNKRILTKNEQMFDEKVQTQTYSTWNCDIQFLISFIDVQTNRNKYFKNDLFRK